MGKPPAKTASESTRSPTTRVRGEGLLPRPSTSSTGFSRTSSLSKITANSDDDGYTIYETMNDRGHSQRSISRPPHSTALPPLRSNNDRAVSTFVRHGAHPLDANPYASTDATLCNLAWCGTSVGLCVGNWDYRGGDARRVMIGARRSMFHDLWCPRHRLQRGRGG